MINTLISSKTRIKLILKFFLNSQNTSYLRGLEQEFGDSSNSIRLELNRFEKSGLLTSTTRGNKKYFKANTSHPLFSDIHNIIMKHVGFDKIIINIIEKLGNLQQVYVLGAFAKGIDSPVIDLMLVGEFDKVYFINLVEKAEAMIERRIRYIIYKTKDSINWDLFDEEALLLWENQ